MGSTGPSSRKGSPLNKSQLIEALSNHFGGNKKAASHALESVLDTITREVAKGEKVAITGFGAFERAIRPARMVRNPRTGERTQAKKTAVPKFRAGAELKAVVSGAKKLPTVAVAAAKATTKKTTTASAAKKTTAKKTTTRKTAAAKKATAKKATAKKAAKKGAAKRAAKKTTAKRAAKKGAATRAAKKTTAKRAAKKTAKRAPAKKTARKAAKKR